MDSRFFFFGHFDEFEIRLFRLGVSTFGHESCDEEGFPESLCK